MSTVKQAKASAEAKAKHDIGQAIGRVMYVWEDRIAGRRAKLDVCRAELIARVALIKSTKWKHFSLHNSAVLLEEALNLHFV